MLAYAVPMDYRRLLLVIMFLALLHPLASQASEPPQLLDKDVPVPMRDGIRLRAEILRPAAVGRFPVLVYRTPYGKEFALREYSTFRKAVERGYAVVVQDVRGRYASDGEFTPYQNEGGDGYDTIEWAAAQPWSTGDVGTFGLSYPGAVQWLAAVENPPHLKAMVPAMTFSTPQNFFYAHGLWDLSWIDWIWDNIAPDGRVKKNLPGPKTYEEAIAAWSQFGPKMLATVPLNQLDELRAVAPYYFEWLRHPPEDPWWDWCELRNKYDRVHAAVLNLSAWYDDNYGPEGATTNFLGLMKSRTGQADPGAHLLLGPWVHGVDSTRSSHSGERSFGPAAVIDYDEVILRWMDHYLRKQQNGVEHEARVRYFVMGENRWHEAQTWPPAAKATSYYLQDAASKLLSTDPPEVQSQSISLISDPANPVTNPYTTSGAHDYRNLSDRKDVLTFDSAPLDHDVEVSGPIHADIFMACNCRDADLWTRLLDVAPDGTAFNLMSPGLDVQRASYRDMVHGRALLESGKIYEIHLNDLVTSNLFAKGHRIRLQISATFFPNFSRNPQDGDSEATSARMQSATISIYTDRQHSSHIVVPIVVN